MARSCGLLRQTLHSHRVLFHRPRLLLLHPHQILPSHSTDTIACVFCGASTYRAYAQQAQELHDNSSEAELVRIYVYSGSGDEPVAT